MRVEIVRAMTAWERAAAIATSASACCARHAVPFDVALDRQLDREPQRPVCFLAHTVNARRSQTRRMYPIGRCVANLPAAFLDLRRRRVERVREQEILVMRVGDARPRM